MKPWWVGTVLGVCLGLWCSAANAEDDAADTAHGSGTHVGLGAGLNLGGPLIGNAFGATTPFAGGSIMVPIDICGSFRMEPDVLFFHQTETVLTGFPGQPVLERDAAVVRPTLGLFGRILPLDRVSVHLGGRLGPTFLLGDNAITPSGESNDAYFSLAPAIGAEYFIDPRFSISTEAQVSVLFDLGDAANIGVASNAVIAARVFFFDSEVGDAS